MIKGVTKRVRFPKVGDGIDSFVKIGGKLGIMLESIGGTGVDGSEWVVGWEVGDINGWVNNDL